MSGTSKSLLKHRVPPPLVAGLFGFTMWAISFVVPTVEMDAAVRLPLSALIIAAGIYFCLAGVISFRRAKTTVNPLKPETTTALVNTGIYAISRNPMYVGFALFLVAWAVCLSSPLLVIGVVGFVVYMNQFQIEPEELALKDIFGAEFTRYQENVRRWL